MTGWVASAGILSVVLGFGAKDTVANLFAGIFIMAGLKISILNLSFILNINGFNG